MNWHTTEPRIPLGRFGWEPYRERDERWDALSRHVSRTISRLNHTGSELRLEVSNRLASIEQNVTRRHIDIDNQRIAMVKGAEAWVVANAQAKKLKAFERKLRRLAAKL